jgi:hypothetical protein
MLHAPTTASTANVIVYKQRFVNMTCLASCRVATHGVIEASPAHGCVLLSAVAACTGAATERANTVRHTGSYAYSCILTVICMSS